jgi:hypothetical protein
MILICSGGGWWYKMRSGRNHHLNTVMTNPAPYNSNSCWPWSLGGDERAMRNHQNNAASQTAVSIDNQQIRRLAVGHHHYGFPTRIFPSNPLLAGYDYGMQNRDAYRGDETAINLNIPSGLDISQLPKLKGISRIEKTSFRTEIQCVHF